MLTSAGLHINALDIEGDMPEIYKDTKHYAGQLSLPERYRLMYWLAKGGRTGRLVPMKPVELTRYARLLEGCNGWEKKFFV